MELTPEEDLLFVRNDAGTDAALGAAAAAHTAGKRSLHAFLDEMGAAEAAFERSHPSSSEERRGGAGGTGGGAAPAPGSPSQAAAGNRHGQQQAGEAARRRVAAAVLAGLRANPRFAGQQEAVLAEAAQRCEAALAGLAHSQ